jgi:hypothetical protein
MNRNEILEDITITDVRVLTDNTVVVSVLSGGFAVGDLTVTL